MLEDATVRIQAIISPDLWETHRVLLRDARALLVQGVVSRTRRAVTVKALRLTGVPLGRVQPADAAD